MKLQTLSRIKGLPFSSASRMCLIKKRERRGPVLSCLHRWLPIVVFLVILVWSYHIIVYQFCIRKVDNKIYMGLLLMGYHLLLCMYLWSWLQCIFTSPVQIPNQWDILAEDVERLQRNNQAQEIAQILANYAWNLPISMSTPEGSVRFCPYCRIIKPDRAHHCRTCRMCVRKMDHHCPWVMNCVHFHNLKYFILFLFYCELYSVYLIVALIYDVYLICQFKVENLRKEHTWVLAQHVAFLILCLFTLGMFIISVANMVRNRTTMESIHPPYFFVCGINKNAFNLGFCDNLRQALGHKWYLWPIPIQTLRGDGLTFPLAIKELNAAEVRGQRRDNVPLGLQPFNMVTWPDCLAFI